MLPPARLGHPSLFPTNSFVLTSLADPALHPFCFDIVAKTQGGARLLVIAAAETKQLIYDGPRLLVNCPSPSLPMRTAARLKEKGDLWADFWKEQQRLESAIDLLSLRMGNATGR